MVTILEGKDQNMVKTLIYSASLPIIALAIIGVTVSLGVI